MGGLWVGRPMPGVRWTAAGSRYIRAMPLRNMVWVTRIGWLAVGIIGLFLLAFPEVSSAQQQAPLQLGARIRVVADTFGAGAETGTYQGLSGNTLRLDRGSERFVLPLASVARLEQSQGKKPNIPAGIVGLLIGAGIGGALGCLANPDDYGVFCGGQDDTKVIVGAVLGGVAGGFAGALLFPRERWSPVDLTTLR